MGRRTGGDRGGEGTDGRRDPLRGGLRSPAPHIAVLIAVGSPAIHEKARWSRRRRVVGQEFWRTWMPGLGGPARPRNWVSMGWPGAGSGRHAGAGPGGPAEARLTTSALFPHSSPRKYTSCVCRGGWLGWALGEGDALARVCRVRPHRAMLNLVCACARFCGAYALAHGMRWRWCVSGAGHCGYVMEFHVVRPGRGLQARDAVLLSDPQHCIRGGRDDAAAAVLQPAADTTRAGKTGLAGPGGRACPVLSCPRCLPVESRAVFEWGLVSFGVGMGSIWVRGDLAPAESFMVASFSYAVREPDARGGGRATSSLVAAEIFPRDKDERIENEGMVNLLDGRLSGMRQMHDRFVFQASGTLSAGENDSETICRRKC